MSASNSFTGTVQACVARHDGQFLVRVKTLKAGDVIAVHDAKLAEGKRVSVSGSPPRLMVG